ncbi:hypothetical protein KNU20_gp56 [Gordonia phage Geodirt]|uniref:Uncharacterized protein n=1 Tax=Gordonia phage Geodirt TaxID=2483670 RepID=A0A3G3MA69_9CAUD|nr:hypothetical protein KNU20_gp56 [Gordonia phage Geodirt]AYR02978.1 hypothetical protein SEA_GEODIRT_56 [Gordonia phage Geodirt]
MSRSLDTTWSDKQGVQRGVGPEMKIVPQNGDQGQNGQTPNRPLEPTP